MSSKFNKIQTKYKKKSTPPSLRDVANDMWPSHLKDETIIKSNPTCHLNDKTIIKSTLHFYVLVSKEYVLMSKEYISLGYTFSTGIN